jgi:hypothetical protein
MWSPGATLRTIAQRYQGDAERPVGGYAVVPGTYAALVSDTLQIGYDLARQRAQES